MSQSDFHKPKSKSGHAGPRRKPNEPEIPQPSFAERTRTLLHRQRVGYLSTWSRRQEGFPFGSIMPYALDALGRPVFLISKMAPHTQNLDQEPKCGLLIPEEDAAGNPLGAARATLLGHAEPVPEEDLASCRELYLERHSNATYWVDYADFGFYRLEVVEVYFVGGFGVMGWVEAGDYGQASPDPLADVAQGIIEHMNQDHADALVLIAAVHAGIEARSAAMTAIDRLGFHLRLELADRYHGCRIAFPRQVGDAESTRAVMVEMVRGARLKQEASKP